MKPGTGTSVAEVTHVSARGVWVLVDDHEHFMSYEDFPWFRDATIGEVLNVERPTPERLRWPDLDVDLAIESIERPERYPLVARDEKED